MKIYFHPDFFKHYAFDPAAEPGRLDLVLSKLKQKYSLLEPRSAIEEEILRAHTERHRQNIARDELLYQTALLSAGAALEAAETAVTGEYAFALNRPPGHHASIDSCWGFCYFNNIAIAVSSLLATEQIRSALIVDFDLHYGDGTDDIFRGNDQVSFWHCRVSDPRRFVDTLEQDLSGYRPDLVAVSAGFDRGIDDWGGMLSEKDYENIGCLLGNFAQEQCNRRLFAVLEGGYNPQALAANIEAFLRGLEEG